MKKKEWKVDKNGRRWFRRPNSGSLWVPVTKTYSDDDVQVRKKCTLDELIRGGMIGMLKYTAEGLLSVLQREGLTDNVWEEVAKVWEIADIAWAAKCNGRNLRQTKAAQRRSDIKDLERKYKGAALIGSGKRRACRRREAQQGVREPALCKPRREIRKQTYPTL